MSHSLTAIVSHGEIDRTPKETYGQGKVVLRVGCRYVEEHTLGGESLILTRIGATGLIKALTEDYLSKRKDGGSITWVCNHSRNTQLALLRGYIDFGLTYERDQEALAASEGWSHTAGCVFHDHFIVVGPISDPAGIAGTRSLTEAFSRIATTQSQFHCRVDASATMWKERSIWSATGYEPWNDKSAISWYKTSVLSPAEALKRSDAAGAYCLADRSTLLHQTRLGTISNSTVFFEPTSTQDQLMNSCYALYSPTAPNPIKREADRFFQYLVSPCGQRLISRYGAAETGLPLFASVDEGYAKERLVGGRPMGGRWVSNSSTIRPRL
ncbi:hypothetical protein jhhlp_008861 [Lomentospora prolificans]|uniref:PBP domain-containing protein n=1 Tax=Lomentospora prolificans TaxID=41688 RepID=A0A2N3MZ75_9PEZI|nr:hypothetical protein jhhlp_008861 [Lomentospora prolificans]